MRIDKRINNSEPEPERLIKHLDPIPFWQNALENPQCKEQMRRMYSEEIRSTNDPPPSNKTRCIEFCEYNLSQTHRGLSMHRKTLPGIPSPNSGNDAEPLSGYCTVLLACARFAIQFNRNSNFDLQVAGRDSKFIPFSFPGCHPWSLKAKVSFQKEFVKSLCCVSKIFNHSNQDEFKIILGGGGDGNLCSP